MNFKTLLIPAFCVAFHPFSTVKAEPSDWLPEGSFTEAAGPPPPTEYLTKGAKLEGLPLLGKLLFNSPSMLGEKAVRLGLSCNSCHPNGHVNTSFYISGLSDKPGNIDLTNRFWRKGREDHIFNPIPIPTLRNVAETAPYGTTLNLSSLVAFTRHVIVDEFDGPEPSTTDMNALISYMILLAKADVTGMPKQVQTTSYSKLIELLEVPLRNQDPEELDRRVFLLKEEYGRRATKDNLPNFVAIIQNMEKIQSYLTTDPTAAKAALDALSFNTLAKKPANPR